MKKQLMAGAVVFLCLALALPAFANLNDIIAFGITTSGRYCQYGDNSSLISSGEYHTDAFHRKGIGFDLRLLIRDDLVFKFGYRRMHADAGDVVVFRRAYVWDEYYGGYDSRLVRLDAEKLADVQIYEIMPGVRNRIASWWYFTVGTGLTIFHAEEHTEITYTGQLEMEFRITNAFGIIGDIQYSRNIRLGDELDTLPSSYYLYEEDNTDTYYADELTWLGWGYNVGIIIYPGYLLSP